MSEIEKEEVTQPVMADEVDEALASSAEEEFTLEEALGEPVPVQSEEIAPAQEEQVTANAVNKEVVKNAVQEYAVSSPRTTGTPDRVAIPPATAETIKERMEAAPNVDMVVSEKQQKWANVLESSLYHMPMKGMYDQRLNEASANFRQDVNFNGQSLRGRAPAFSKKPGTQIAEGERALLQLVTHLGVGGLFRAPLWNSGIWVTFKPATESELLELNRIIYSDKIALGRWSYGLALSNSIVYTLDRIFDFVLAHVYNTSIKSDELPIQNLRDWIAPQDINSFIWGFLCANYPSGFHYETGCINDAAKCNHVIEENLNVTKLQWTDNSMLTEWQKQHMSSMAANSKSLDSVKRYREEMTRLQEKRIILNQGTPHEIAVTIKTPTVTQYIEQGHKWISGIVESVNAVLTLDSSDENRNTLINKKGKATTLCQYVHWIKSIEYGELTGHEDASEERSVTMIEDQNSIEETLKLLSATDSIREEIIEAILKYINDSTISVIGVPAFDCPVCGMAQDGEKVYPRHTSIVPLDVIQVFFALLGQRLSRVETR